MLALCLAAAAFLLAPGELRWVRDGAPTPQALALVRALESSGLKGLDPADYDGAAWEDRLAGLYSESARRSFDRKLTEAAERYVADLSAGRIDPREAGAAIDRRLRFDARAFVRALSTADDVGERLRGIEPALPSYRLTLAALEEYQDLARRDEGAPFAAEETIEPGASWTEAGRLADRLSLLGDLHEPHEARSVYDGALVAALKRFQRRHGLPADGKIGPATLEALNVPLSHRVQQLRLVLERLRWLPAPLPARRIVVNVPEFRLRVFGPEGVFATKVVVGTAFEHPTPIFASALRRVIFRPAWNVPASIERDELAAEFARDPGSMEKLGFEALDAQGRVVPPAEAIARLATGELRLRQQPGPKNALGLVKFDLPNPFGVYLHGTPARGLFGRTRRDFSHGCIRVADAEAVAARVLGWPRSRVRSAMRGKTTVAVPVPAPVPVFVLYATAVVSEDGTVRFFDDIYGDDAMLERALERARAQPFRTSAEALPQDSRAQAPALRLHGLRAPWKRRSMSWSQRTRTSARG